MVRVRSWGEQDDFVAACNESNNSSKTDDDFAPTVANVLNVETKSSICYLMQTCDEDLLALE